SLAPAYDLRLSQVLANLLKNAIEASPETTTVRITIATDAPSADAPPIENRKSKIENLLIHIEDSGAGLPPTLLPSLFTPFVTTKPKGTGHGLGLAISRELVASLHGNLTLENRQPPATGCLATITLPLTPSPQPTSPSPNYQLPFTNY
ncbi:MAG: sensor histidine kinase, partial [Phycisphaerae bacterium]